MKLPKGWQTVRLGGCCRKNYGGGTPSTRVPEYWDGEIEWVTSAQLGEPLRIDTGARRITPLALENSATQLVPAGSLLVATRVGVGKTAINAKEIAMSQDLTALAVDENEFSTEFLAYFLRSTAPQERFRQNSRGATIKGIPRDDLLATIINKPPVKEQRAIAAALSKLQAASNSQESTVERLTELKTALMARLFRESLGWKPNRLGDVATIGNGSTPRRTHLPYWDGGTVPWLTSGKVHEGTIRQADEFVTDAALRECHLPLVPPGSIVMAITGQGKTLGNAAMVTFQTTVSQHLARITLTSDEALPQFVLGFLRHRYRELRQAAYGAGSTKGALTCGFLKDYLVPLPELGEQRRIAGILTAIDDSIAAASEKHAKLLDLFQISLNDLVSGRIRVPAEFHEEI